MLQFLLVASLVALSHCSCDTTTLTTECLAEDGITCSAGCQGAIDAVHTDCSLEEALASILNALLAVEVTGSDTTACEPCNPAVCDATRCEIIQTSAFTTAAAGLCGSSCEFCQSLLNDWQVNCSDSCFPILGTNQTSDCGLLNVDSITNGACTFASPTNPLSCNNNDFCTGFKPSCTQRFLELTSSLFTGECQTNCSTCQDDVDDFVRECGDECECGDDCIGGTSLPFSCSLATTTCTVPEPNCIPCSDEEPTCDDLSLALTNLAFSGQCTGDCSKCLEVADLLNSTCSCFVPTFEAANVTLGCFTRIFGDLTASCGLPTDCGLCGINSPDIITQCSQEDGITCTAGCQAAIDAAWRTPNQDEALLLEVLDQLFSSEGSTEACQVCNPDVCRLSECLVSQIQAIFFTEQGLCDEESCELCQPFLDDWQANCANTCIVVNGEGFNSDCGLAKLHEATNGACRFDTPPNAASCSDDDVCTDVNCVGLVTTFVELNLAGACSGDCVNCKSIADTLKSDCECVDIPQLGARTLGCLAAGGQAIGAAVPATCGLPSDCSACPTDSSAAVSSLITLVMTLFVAWFSKY